MKESWGLASKWAVMLGAWNARRAGALGLAIVGLFFAGYLGASCAQRPDPGDLSLENSIPEAGPGEVLVHVAGAVRKPGVYALSSETRVIDAIQKAGGLAANADPDRLNLAERVVDGTQIVVPLKGGVAPAPSGPAPVASPGPSASGGLVSINSASAAELDTLPGIGPATAAKIIEYRQSRGGFRSIEELAAVKGIGPKKLEQLRPRVRL